MAANSLPKLPRAGFPIRPHRNGQWFKSVWNPRTKKSEQFYFGTWADDSKGERAMRDPQLGWLARKDAIRAGADNLRVEPVNAVGMTLGELMARFLTHKRDKVAAGELSLTTLGDYLREIPAFVAFMKPLTPAGALKPEHFGAYMKYLIEDRKLGRMSRKRVRAYVTAFIRHGAKNDWYVMPNCGTNWTAPATDPDSMRQARARAGIPDYSDRIVSGEEIDKLMVRANPNFKAMILLAANAGLGPADIGRLHWSMVDLDRRRLICPRGKTGRPRRAFLWKKTVAALRRARLLKHNREMLAAQGEVALVFLTRKNQPYYRETPIVAQVNLNGVAVKKLKRVEVCNAISITFSRLAKELKMPGVTFYRLRHTARTVGKRARDGDALDLLMGHANPGIGRVYDHEAISWPRMKRLAKVIHRQLWPKIKPAVGTQRQTPTIASSGADDETARGAAV